jgi:hypothetical protein
MSTAANQRRTIINKLNKKERNKIKLKSMNYETQFHFNQHKFYNYWLMEDLCTYGSPEEWLVAVHLFFGNAHELNIFLSFVKNSIFQLQQIAYYKL